MSEKIFIIVLTLMSLSCGEIANKERELESKDKELNINEQKVALKENTLSEETVKEKRSEAIAVETVYKTYNPCSFVIDLPLDLTLIPIDEEETNLDYCDYKVKTADGFEMIQIYSLINSRFEFESIQEAYQMALKQSKVEITYKIQKDNWFIISGFEKGNIVYWKRVWGDHFVSDLSIEYPKARKGQIEPYISRISESFKSH